VEEAAKDIPNFFYWRVGCQTMSGVVDACLDGVRSGILVRSDGVDWEGEV
jgi:hypothetical protein